MNKAFMSDNTAPVDKRILEFLSGVNDGFEKPYGNDQWTEQAELLIKNEFGKDAQFFPVLTGTGANVISLASVLSPFQGVVCASSAHINVDECGAPERFLGSKLIGLETTDGKITPDIIKPTLHSIGFEHHSQPYVISVSQTAETGVVYSIAELNALSKFAKENGMIFHVDGSRISNAAAYLWCSLSDACTGADILSFGGTKNGMMMGEAVIIINPAIGPNLKYFRKQGMQLFSKMRYISAQFIPYLKESIWKENAEHA
ncbi:MAG: threonine aldolase, partial [Denitrovibrio sp.]